MTAVHCLTCGVCNRNGEGEVVHSDTSWGEGEGRGGEEDHEDHERTQHADKRGGG